MANFLAEHNLLRIEDVPVEAYALFRSHALAGGAQYEVLCSYPLAAGIRHGADMPSLHMDGEGQA